MHSLSFSFTLHVQMYVPRWKCAKLRQATCNKCTKNYCIVRNFGEVFNLAIWRFCEKLPNLKFTNINLLWRNDYTHARMYMQCNVTLHACSLRMRIHKSTQVQWRMQDFMKEGFHYSNARGAHTKIWGHAHFQALWRETLALSINRSVFDRDCC